MNWPATAAVCFLKEHHNMRLKVNLGTLEDQQARIEMLPLLDVVFLLLVFFIYAMISLRSYTRIPVALPASSAVQDKELKKPLIITLDEKNAVFFEGDAVSVKDLLPLIKQAIRFSPRPIIIDGDQASSLGAVVEIMDLLRAAQVQEVSFRCRKKP